MIEDDKDLNRQLVAALERAGYAVDSAMDGEEGHFLGDTEPYDAVVLDIGLPKMDGISALTAWRKAGRDTPVLILTARDGWRKKCRVSTPAPTIMCQSRFISRRSWRDCAPCCAARPATRPTSCVRAGGAGHQVRAATVGRANKADVA